MRGIKKYKAIYLMVAFAIFWVSFASIIQFHLTKIYGTELAGSIEFVKSAHQKTFNKDPKLLLKTDLNTSSVLVEKSSFCHHFYQLQKLIIQNDSDQIIHFCFESPSHRGPPVL